MEIMPYQKSDVFQNFYDKRCILEQKTQNYEKIEKQNYKKDENIKYKTAISGLLGAALPVCALNIKENGIKEIFKNSSTITDKLKSVCKLFETNKYHKLIASMAGAIGFATYVGYGLDNDPKNKKTKIEEGAFEFLNAAIPTTLLAFGEKFIEKKENESLLKGNKQSYALARGLLTAASVAGGMFVANKTSNKLNEKVFEKDEENPSKRHFKISDCLVHIDDITGLFILTKNPALKAIADKCQMDKILPLLYAKCGYEAGTKEKE